MNVNINVEPKELILAACVAGVSRIMDRRRDGRYHYLESKIAVDMGRQSGHTKAACVLFDKYTKEGWDVWIVSCSIGLAEHIRVVGRENGINIPKNRLMSIRRFLNPYTWCGRYVKKHMFIFDTTMQGLTNTVEKFHKTNNPSLMKIDDIDMPIFIGLGMN